MITLETFQRIRECHSRYASWAVWADEGQRPKDNMGDITVLDPDINHSLLNTLNANYIFLALNISRPVKQAFGNFHDSSRMATDYKIRAALRGTRFWGSYMTDIIKDFEQKVSGKVMSYLKKDVAFEEHNIRLLEQEISDLGAEHPVLIAFGKDAATIADRNLGNHYKIVCIPHYAKYISHIKHRDEVNRILSTLPQ